MNSMRQCLFSFAHLFGCRKVSSDSMSSPELSTIPIQATDPTMQQEKISSKPIDLQQISLNEEEVDARDKGGRTIITDISGKTGQSNHHRFAEIFIREFSKGVIIESASTACGIKKIKIRVTSTHIMWGAADAKELNSTPLLDIERVEYGLAPHLISKFGAELSQRCLYITVKSKSASFVTPSISHRDVFIKGLRAVLQTLLEK